MAQKLRQKAVQTFTKGLITERGELTFPEDASIDELNCSLDKDGLRRKRLSVQFEAQYDELHKLGDEQTFYVWSNAGGVEGKRILVAQSGGALFFYNLGEAPYSNLDNRIKIRDYQVDLNPAANPEFEGVAFGRLPRRTHGSLRLATTDYVHSLDALVNRLPSGNVFPEDYRWQFTEINGVLIGTHPNSSPTAFVYREPRTDSISGNQLDNEHIVLTSITLRIRDFTWLSYDYESLSFDANDLNANDTIPNTSPPKYVNILDRWYNARNSGWGPDELGNTGGPEDIGLGSRSGLQLPLTHPWYSGKDEDGDFDLDEWRKVGKGAKGLTGNGRFIFDFHKIERKRIDNVLGAGQDEYEPWKPSTCAVMQQRVFYAGWKSSKNGGKILFSSILEPDGSKGIEVVGFGSSSPVPVPSTNYSGLGECFQRNDPTSEYSSDLLPDDGGVIDIAEAYEIRRIINVRDSIFVFAENGIWIISGAPFAADSYSIERLSNIGITSPESLIMVGESPFWWSKEGIHTISYNEQTGRADVTNIAEQTIQKFYDGIELFSRDTCTAVYDEPNKKIHWFYGDVNLGPNRPKASSAATGPLSYRTRKNRVLTLDLSHQSFYPWKIEDGYDPENSIIGNSFVCGATWFDGYGSEIQNFNVVSQNPANPTGPLLTVTTVTGNNVVSPASVKIDTGTSDLLLFCQGPNNKLTIGGFTGTSFYDFNNVSEGGYEAFVESGYDFMGDLLTKKNSPYILTYMRQEEEGFVLDPATGQFVPDRPQSLLLSSYWDLRKNTSSTPQQCYRYKYPLNSSNPDVFPYPVELMQTRLKMRGHGRVMRMRFEGEVGKDFQLLGYGIIQGGNNKY
jgi:hypothetical protein